MKRITILRMCLLLLAVILCLPAESAVRKRKIRPNRNPDSLVAAVLSHEPPSSRKMNTSAFPVQISVTGRVVQIQSDHSQLLPIYNQNGILYLTPQQGHQLAGRTAARTLLHQQQTDNNKLKGKVKAKGS